MNTNFFAQHNFSAPARNVDELRAGLSGGSFGKGSTAEQGEASALMERSSVIPEFIKATRSD